MKTNLRPLALAAFVLAVPAAAQDPPPRTPRSADDPAVRTVQDPAIRTADEPVTLTAIGTIVSSTASSLVIKADDGSRKTFVVDADSILPEKRSAGERVSVTYETKGTRMRAVSVDPTDAKPPAGRPRPTPKSRR